MPDLATVVSEKVFFFCLHAHTRASRDAVECVCVVVILTQLQILLSNIATESFFGAWLFVSPATLPEFPGAPSSSFGALTSRRMYASSILALSAAAVLGHITGQRAHALVSFAVLHLCLVATFLLAHPAGLPERLGTALHLALGVASLMAAHRSISTKTK